VHPPAGPQSASLILDFDLPFLIGRLALDVGRAGAALRGGNADGGGREPAGAGAIGREVRQHVGAIALECVDAQIERRTLAHSGDLTCPALAIDTGKARVEPGGVIATYRLICIIEGSRRGQARLFIRAQGLRRKPLAGKQARGSVKRAVFEGSQRQHEIARSVAANPPGK